MKTFNPFDYPSILDKVIQTYEEIENQIRNYRLRFIQVRDKDVEWGIRFPEFIPCFYQYLQENNRILSQNEYWEYYLLSNKEFFSDKGFRESTMDGLKARIFITYPSLVRDIHFAKYIKHNLTEGEVVYNQKLDLEEGPDLLIIREHKYFGFNLYTNTTRGREAREKKKYRHVKFDNVKYIELLVNFKDSVKCGDFFLYGENEYKRILTILENGG